MTSGSASTSANLAPAPAAPPAAYTPSSPPSIPSRHAGDDSPPDLNTPAPAAPDRLTDANLKKQNRQISYGKMSYEQKKRSYSADLFEYTKSMCDGLMKQPGGPGATNEYRHGSGSTTDSNDSSTLSMSSLSIRGKDEKHHHMASRDDPARTQSRDEVARSIGAVPAVH